MGYVFGHMGPLGYSGYARIIGVDNSGEPIRAEPAAPAAHCPGSRSSASTPSGGAAPGFGGLETAAGRPDGPAHSPPTRS